MIDGAALNEKSRLNRNELKIFGGKFKSNILRFERYLINLREVSLYRLKESRSPNYLRIEVNKNSKIKYFVEAA